MAAVERDLGRRWFDEVWNQGRREAISEMMVEDVVIYDGAQITHGVEAFQAFFDRLHTVFSDFHVAVEDTVLEGDKLCIRWSVKARHTGDGLGIPPTNAEIQTTGMSLVRVKDGKIAESWQNWDMLGMMDQIKGAEKPALTYIA